MNNIDINTKTLRKMEDLRTTSLANAVAGMRKFTALDERCIMFTVHMQDTVNHKDVCKIIFDETEKFISETRTKQTSASHSGICSFTDHNGSKFSGANRDVHSPHCHGCIFIPHGIVTMKIDALIQRIHRSLRGRTDLIRCSPNAIHFAKFEKGRNDAKLLDYIGYAQKDETRAGTGGCFGVFLPFDTRVEFGPDIAEKIIKKRDKVLEALGSNERFKVLAQS